MMVSLKFKVMGRNTSVSLGNYFEDFVENRISEGRFKNASEVIRAGLRLLEEKENKVIALRTAIQEGIDSGIVKNFNAKKTFRNSKSQQEIGIINQKSFTSSALRSLPLQSEYSSSNLYYHSW